MKKLPHKTGNKPWNPKTKFRISELSIGRRLFIYLATLVCIVCSMLQVVLEIFPFAFGIVIYVLAAVGLGISSYYITRYVVRDVKEVIRPKIMENPYTRKVVTEYRLRTILFTVPGTFSNMVFALFNGVVAITGRSAWLGTMAAYYILLAVMRVGAVGKERKISRITDKRIREREELRVYKRNSILFVFLAIVLGGAVILLECSQGGKAYPGLTIYAAAAYSFYKIIMSTINLIKVGKQNSMLLAIIRRIGYVDACVSILTLQTAMFHSFAQGQENFTKIMNGITGTAVCLMVLALGIYGLIVANRKGGK